MINNASATLAIIIAERVEAQYATNEFEVTFATIEDLMKKHLSISEQSIEVIEEVRNQIHHLNEMTYLNAFRDAYQLFLELGRTN